jgi:hypothetical protein
VDEILQYLGTHFAAEWAVITGAPIISLVTFAVLGVVQYFIFKAYYHHQLSAKESIISTRDGEIALLERRLEGVGTTTTPVPVLKPDESQPEVLPAEIEKSTTDRPQTDRSVELPIGQFFGRIFNLPKPAIARSESRLQPIARNDDETFRPLHWKSDWEWVSFVGIFKNDPIIQPVDSRETVRPTGPAKRVVARVAYFRENHEAVLELNFGAWLSTLGGETPFQVGDVRYLVLALCEKKNPDQWYALEDCRNTAYSDIGVKLVPLSSAVNLIRIKLLVDGEAVGSPDIAINLADLTTEARKAGGLPLRQSRRRN